MSSGTTGTVADRRRDDARGETLADRWAWLGQLRERVSSLPGGRTTWRILVGVVGLLIIVGGIILLPLPGPGWAIIFVGLGVWAIEFEWAGRLLAFARRQVRRWTDWVKAQPRPVQLLVGALGLLFLAAVAVGSYFLYRVISG